MDSEEVPQMIETLDAAIRASEGNETLREAVGQLEKAIHQLAEEIQSPKRENSRSNTT